MLYQLEGNLKLNGSAIKTATISLESVDYPLKDIFIQLHYLVHRSFLDYINAMILPSGKKDYSIECEILRDGNSIFPNPVEPEVITTLENPKEALVSICNELHNSVKKYA